MGGLWGQQTGDSPASLRGLSLSLALASSAGLKQVGGQPLAGHRELWGDGTARVTEQAPSHDRGHGPTLHLPTGRAETRLWLVPLRQGQGGAAGALRSGWEGWTVRLLPWSPA